MMSFFKKINYWCRARRLGPDLPLTHLLLYSNRLNKWLCNKKFGYFGSNSFFRPGAYAIETAKIYIGDNVVIRPGTMLFASPYGNDIITHIKIESDVLIGSCVHIYVSNHEYADISIPIAKQGHANVLPVYLRKGCWIGANVTILPGVEIGENTVIGANSLVTKSIPPYSVAVGNPAKIIKKLNE